MNLKSTSQNETSEKYSIIYEHIWKEGVLSPFPVPICRILLEGLRGDPTWWASKISTNKTHSVILIRLTWSTLTNREPQWIYSPIIICIILRCHSYMNNKDVKIKSFTQTKFQLYVMNIYHAHSAYLDRFVPHQVSAVWCKAWDKKLSGVEWSRGMESVL